MHPVNHVAQDPRDASTALGCSSVALGMKQQIRQAIPAHYYNRAMALAVGCKLQKHVEEGGSSISVAWNLLTKAHAFSAAHQCCRSFQIALQEL